MASPGNRHCAICIGTLKFHPFPSVTAPRQTPITVPGDVQGHPRSRKSDLVNAVRWYFSTRIVWTEAYNADVKKIKLAFWKCNVHVNCMCAPRKALPLTFVGLSVRNLNYTVFQKTSTFLFFEWLCQKLTDFNDFWCVKSGENLTWTSYTFFHLTCQM